MKNFCQSAWSTLLGFGIVFFLFAAIPATTYAQDKPKKGKEVKEEPKDEKKSARAPREKKKTPKELEAEAKAAEKLEKQNAKASKKLEWKKVKETIPDGSVRIRPISALAGNYVLMLDFPIKSKNLAWGLDIRGWTPGEVIAPETANGITAFDYYGGGINFFAKYVYGEHVYAQGIYGQFSVGGAYHHYDVTDEIAGDGVLDTGSWKVALMGGYQWAFGKFTAGAGLGLNYTGIIDRNIDFDNNTLESLDYIHDGPYSLPFDLTPELDITIGYTIK